MNKIVILTAPHSYCFNMSRHIHMCDFISEAALNTLAHIFLKHEVLLYINKSNVDRRDLDLNRLESRNHPFRTNLNDLINSLNVDKVVLLDIHSFPFGGKSFQNAEIAIMTLSESEEYGNLITQYLINNNIFSISVKGSNLNDIIYTSIHQGVKRSVLLEFNEGLSHERLSYICQLIVDFIISH